ncbi:anthrone oxygenase family protein [Streptomyces sp. NPDC059564]|uniref:anthrone oxygenase family protein n=1 Tax=Streptomyces sp. NPDC059564 TaxID=3346865 RepID=UPI0036A234BE
MDPQRPTPSGTGATRGGKAAGFLLGLATVLVGLMAGLFFAFDVSVMPGLAASDAPTYVTAMRHFNEAIDGNGLFGTAFVLALLAAAAAAIVEYRAGRRGAALWAGAAAVAYLVVLVLTFAVNIPLNNELAAAGDAAGASAASVTDKFKGTWVPVNIVRTVLSTAALAALARALLLHGRATPAGGGRASG